MDDKIYGRNPVIEALTSGREIDKILIQDGIKHSQISKIVAMAKERKIPFQFVDKHKLSDLVQGENHQGVVQYTQEKIGLNAGRYRIYIEGEDLVITSLSADAIYVEGRIRQVQYEV